MTYANSDEVTRKIEKIDIVSNIDSDLLNDAITTGDDLVNAELVDTSITGTAPEAIVKAATLLAAAEYLDNVSAIGDDRSPTAKAWENKAYKLIKGWLAENQNSQPIGGYSRHNTSKYRPFRHSKTHRHHRRRF